MAHFGLIIKILKFKCIVEVRYRLVCKRQISFFLNMSPIKNVKRNKIIGYIPDLQHIHLPYLFTEEERAFS